MKMSEQVYGKDIMVSKRDETMLICLRKARACQDDSNPAFSHVECWHSGTRRPPGAGPRTPDDATIRKEQDLPSCSRRGLHIKAAAPLRDESCAGGTPGPCRLRVGIAPCARKTQAGGGQGGPAAGVG